MPALFIRFIGEFRLRRRQYRSIVLRRPRWMAKSFQNPEGLPAASAPHSDWRIMRRMALQVRPYWSRVGVIFILSLASMPSRF
jgi:hypothetical protein